MPFKAWSFKLLEETFCFQAWSFSQGRCQHVTVIEVVCLHLDLWWVSLRKEFRHCEGIGSPEGRLVAAWVHLSWWLPGGNWESLKCHSIVMLQWWPVTIPALSTFSDWPCVPLDFPLPCWASALVYNFKIKSYMVPRAAGPKLLLISQHTTLSQI